MLRKNHKIISNSKNSFNYLLKFGKFGIKSSSYLNFSEDQLKNFNWIILTNIKKILGKKNSIKIWNLICLNSNLTKLSLESRMGKGKGNLHKRVLFIKPGKILFEFDKISYTNMLKLFNRLGTKFPGKLIFIFR